MLVSGYNVNVVAAIHALTCDDLTNAGRTCGKLVTARQTKTQLVIVTARERPAQRRVSTAVGQ